MSSALAYGTIVRDRKDGSTYLVLAPFAAPYWSGWYHLLVLTAGRLWGIGELTSRGPHWLETRAVIVNP